jgi:hypothetical protein
MLLGLPSASIPAAAAAAANGLTKHRTGPHQYRCIVNKRWETFILVNVIIFIFALAAILFMPVYAILSMLHALPHRCP